jgi:hypothetical protein
MFASAAERTLARRNDDGVHSFTFTFTCASSIITLDNCRCAGVGADVWTRGRTAAKALAAACARFAA